MWQRSTGKWTHNIVILYSLVSLSNFCLVALEGDGWNPSVLWWPTEGSCLGPSCVDVRAVGSQKLHVYTADPHQLNKAKCPVDSSSSRQIQINSWDVAPTGALDMIDKQCGRRPKNRVEWRGGAGCLNNVSVWLLLGKWEEKENRIVIKYCCVCTSVENKSTFIIIFLTLDKVIWYSYRAGGGLQYHNNHL